MFSNLKKTQQNHECSISYGMYNLGETCALPFFPVDSCICTLLLPVFSVFFLHATKSPRSLSSSPLYVPWFLHHNKKRSLKRMQLTEKDNWLTWSAVRVPGLDRCPKDWKYVTSATHWHVQKNKQTSNTFYTKPKAL
jgi:hypothetical protein